ncbi:MAG TPA: adenylosuccinate lyase [Candidatus Marinimicrobia bacterium]|nr:adenylosuccinate lyase [Candidatus Neomarinimicrobiota bacterium]
MIERYSTPDMKKIWDEEARFKYWLDVEIAVCEAQAEAGIIPQGDLETIKAKADFHIPRILEIEETTQHDVIAFLTNVAEYVGPASRWIHYGMTSSDLLDTAFALQLRDAANLILQRLTALEGILRQKAIQYKNLLTIGRTHGIHAEPTSYGLKFLNWHQEIQRHIRRWESVSQEISCGKVSGAVGTYTHIDPLIEEKALQKLALKTDPVSTQVISRDRHAVYLAAIAAIGASLEKISIELRHLQRTEVLEVEEPFRSGQKGSSAMPHKKNPIISERITGMARLLRAYLVTAMENIALWHERDISHSSTERIIFPDACHLMDYMLQKISYILRDMRIHEKNIKRNLELTGGLYHSQKFLLFLVEKGLTREKAYSLIQKSALESWQSRIPLKELLLKDENVGKLLNKEEADELFNDGNALKNIDYIYKRCGIVL